MDLEQILKQLIKNVNYPFKSSQELEMALKKRLTKKEFKLLKEIAKKIPEHTIKANLGFDDNEFSRVKANLQKKLNQEQTKQLLYSYNTPSIETNEQ